MTLGESLSVALKRVGARKIREKKPHKGALWRKKGKGNRKMVDEKVWPNNSGLAIQSI